MVLVRATVHALMSMQLIGPITQPTGVDPIVQGLCAFLLGVCYEFNREPGEVTRCVEHRSTSDTANPEQSHPVPDPALSDRPGSIRLEDGTPSRGPAVQGRAAGSVRYRAESSRAAGRSAARGRGRR